MNFISQEGFNDQQQALDSKADTEFDPSFTSGSAGALFNGIANGFVQVASQAQAGGYNMDEGAGALMGLISSDSVGPSPETIRENALWASSKLRPDPETTGTMANILFGVGDVGARFATGFAVGGVYGGAVLSGGSVGEERYQELIRQGVDQKTALKAASVRGIATGAGAILPAGIGGSLLTRVASGAGINVAAGAAGRGAEGATLSAYQKQANELHAFSMQDVAVDAVLGAIFGGVSRLGVDVSHDQLDAALNLKNAKSYAIDGMPGEPLSTGDLARHSKAMDTAIDDLLNDRPVSIDAESAGVKFAQRNLSENSRIVADAFYEEGYAGFYNEMVGAEARAADINRGLSEFAPEEVQSIPPPESIRMIETENLKGVEAGDVIVSSRDVGGIKAGRHMTLESISDSGDFYLRDGRTGERVSISAAEARDALDASYEIRRPIPRDPDVPVAYDETSPASTVLAEADSAIESANTEGKAYNAAVDCFLSRGN